MLAGKVIATATATVKRPSLEGVKMLVACTDTEPYIAIDCIGAGIGDTVLITRDASFASVLTGMRATPVRWSVFGIAD